MISSIPLTPTEENPPFSLLSKVSSAFSKFGTKKFTKNSNGKAEYKIFENTKHELHNENTKEEVRKVLSFIDVESFLDINFQKNYNPHIKFVIFKT